MRFRNDYRSFKGCFQIYKVAVSKHPRVEFVRDIKQVCNNGDIMKKRKFRMSLATRRCCSAEFMWEKQSYNALVKAPMRELLWMQMRMCSRDMCQEPLIGDEIR